ncbi:hypothetical protein Back2_07240 [Nocardioides baekrokdamisoli]|uniref:Uncharacterized protein n=2 Tax=Nocardioides baekrokdamisoli TaxID=1804624 RepID=A0A3G9IC16_9ACTN|nr:hypothetical protein Back2_07240 [Nocardioides baekrokdamisoli]
MSARDIADVEALRASEEQRAALGHLTGLDVAGEVSESLVLRTVFELGLQAFHASLEEAGYAAIAEGYDSAAEKRAARRRRPEWADES